MNYRNIDPFKILKILTAIEYNSVIIKINKSSKRIAYFDGKGCICFASYRERLLSINSWLTLFNMIIKTILKRGGKYNIKNLLAFIYICRTNLKADKIRLKNNIVSLYPKEGIACKFTRYNSKRGDNSLLNEYLILKRLQNFENLRAPIAYSYITEPVNTLFMEYIDGREIILRKEPKLAYHIICQLFSWYKFCGVETINAFNHSIISRILYNEDNLEKYGWDISDSLLIRNALFYARSLKITTSIIHGDLYKSNIMINNDGKLYILDWELSRNDMVALDIIELCSISKDIELRWNDWRNEITIDKTSVNPNVELGLAYIVKNYQLNKLKDKIKKKEILISICHSIIDNKLINIRNIKS